MEPEGSSPYTQEPATCPYPEPDQSPTANLPLENVLWIQLLHKRSRNMTGFRTVCLKQSKI
jgi:hypothetical protein